MNLKKNTSTLEIVRVSLHELMFLYQSIKPGDITNGFILLEAGLHRYMQEGQASF